MLLLAFYYLSFVADDHLSPAMHSLSKTLKLSQSLAGVTLISFAAGAADVFAGLSASKDAEVEGIQLGLGVLLGSSLFILAIVAVSCIFSSPTDIKLNKNFFIRDAVFLMTVLALLWYAVYMKGVIDMNISISMIAMYGIYAVVVLI